MSDLRSTPLQASTILIDSPYTRLNRLLSSCTIKTLENYSFPRFHTSAPICINFNLAFIIRSLTQLLNERTQFSTTRFFVFLLITLRAYAFLLISYNFKSVSLLFQAFFQLSLTVLCPLSVLTSI